MVDISKAANANTPIPIGNDHLNFKYDEEIMTQLDPQEHIVFSCKVIKINRFGMKQERNLLLTTHQLCNVKSHQFQRRIAVNRMIALSKCSEKGNGEFVVHVQNEYSYRFICELRDELFEALKAVYFKTANKNLHIYSVSKCKDYATSKKDAAAGNFKTPPEDFRVVSEDIYEPIQEGSQKHKAPSNVEPDDFPIDDGKVHRPTFVKKGNDKDCTLSDFHLLKVIGRGSFGKVFLVQKKNKPGQVFAMKSLRKDVIIDYDQIESTKLEKDILLQADHPFLVGMHYVFQTDQKIFFVMRFVRGGELFTHLRSASRFNEERARFYAIQVAISLGHLHQKKIIYRDLKPENILLDSDGYICLTDFGLAKILEGNAQAFSFCGTPDYLAPEILNEVGHSFPVDWWALGILTYEMIVGFPPFYTGSSNNKKMYELIKKKPVYFPDPQRHQIEMSENCKDFISKLLKKDAPSRLGTTGGIDEILKHPWFEGLDVQKLLAKQIDPPFKPTLSSDAEDVSNFDTQFVQEEAKITMIEEPGQLKLINNNQAAFKDF